MNQDSKVWFITGASTGFGRAFAEYAISRGYRVVVTARQPEKLQDLVNKAPTQVLSLKLDVNDREQIATAAQTTLEKFGRVDVLLNNAGYGIVGALEETPEDELRAVMNTNFFAAVAVTQAFLPAMRHQRSGAIVNISSMGGQMSFAGFSAYSASKFALEGASEALAGEMKAFGVKVLIVEPGAFRTEFASAALKQMPVIAAYKDVVGGTRDFASGMHGTQDGDPLKAAAAIDRAIQDPSTPLRLQLGADAVGAIRAHTQTLLADLEKWESVAVDTKIG